MSFEDDVRSSLHIEADDLELRGRGATEVMHLARRRQHRARRAGAVAAVGVLGVGVVSVVAVRGRTDDGVSVTAFADQVGLPDLGPLELSWTTTSGAVTGGVAGETRFTEDGGVLYALSTAPGARYLGDGSSPEPALYQLGEDGTWVLAGSQGAVPLVDLASAGPILYAIGTAPGTSGVGYDAVVSSSSDGGGSWVPSSITPVTPPSAATAWEASSTLSIERVPGATVAIVSSRFSPPQSLLDRAAATAGADAGDDYGYEVTDAGFDVVSFAKPLPAEDPGSGATPPGSVVPTTTGPTVPAAPLAGAPVTSIAPDGSRVPAGGPDAKARAEAQIADTREVVASIPWSDVGLTGRDDLYAAQVLVERDGAWTPVASPALDGISISRLAAAGQDLILEGSDESGRTTVLTSTDGATWRPVAVGEDSRISGLGNAWVDVPLGSAGSPVVRSSVDQGASWSSIDLGAVDGRLASATVTSIDSGPLGLAAIAVDHGDEPDRNASYLVTTRDLQHWTVTPLRDIAGDLTAAASVHVGTDRIVVTASERYTGDDSALAASVTAIGTPLR